MLEAGLVRSEEHVTMQLTKERRPVQPRIAVALCTGSIGYNLMYPLGNWSIGSDETGGYLGAEFRCPRFLKPVGITRRWTPTIMAMPRPARTYFFQLMFCRRNGLDRVRNNCGTDQIVAVPDLRCGPDRSYLPDHRPPGNGAVAGSRPWAARARNTNFAASPTLPDRLLCTRSVAGRLWRARMILGRAVWASIQKDRKVVPMLGSNLPLATLGYIHPLARLVWLQRRLAAGNAGTVGDVTDVSRIFANTNTAAASGGAIAALILTQDDVWQSGPDHGAERRAGGPCVDHR